MKRIAVRAALGWGLLFVATALPSRAAEWLFVPLYSASVDYDSNRRLEPAGDTKGSEAGVLTADLTFERLLEDSSFFIEPRFSLRRFSDNSLGNGDDRSIYGAYNWLGEKLVVNATASYWDQSTLLTELLETGIINADTHREQGQANVGLQWSETERWQLVSQLGFSNTKYTGVDEIVLPGFRYLSYSLGERYSFSERGSITVSAFGDSLTSAREPSSHEAGVQLELIYVLSETSKFDASVGQSERVLQGERGSGTNYSVLLSHDFSVGNGSLNYNRSLVPYGTGILVQRDAFTASWTYPFSEYLDTTLSFLRVENNRTTVELGLDRKSYTSGAASLNWHPSDTVTVSGQASALRTQTLGPFAPNVNEWRTALTVTWKPHPISRSW